MFTFAAGLMAALAWPGATDAGPGEEAMREAFASELAGGVRRALAYVAVTSGDAALAGIRAARLDQFEIRVFRKLDCRPSANQQGHFCGFVVEIETVAGSIEGAVAGRFFDGPSGLAFDPDA